MHMVLFVYMAWTNTPEAIAKKKATMLKNGTKQGKPLKFGKTTPQELQAMVDSYLGNGDKHHTVTGLAVALGTNRMTLINLNGLDIDKELKHIIATAKQRIQHEYEANALSGNANAAMSIFTLKNNFGWVDRVENVNLNANLNINADIDASLAGDFAAYLKQRKHE